MPDRDSRPSKSTIPKLAKLLVLGAGAWFAASAASALAGLAIAPRPSVRLPPAAPARPPDGPSVLLPLVGVSVERYEIGREELESLTGWCISAPARIVPYFRDGKQRGWQIFSVQPRSIYARLQIESGDVIVRIDDQPLTTPEHALDRVARVREGSFRSIEVERGGRTLRKELVIVEPQPEPKSEPRRDP